MRRYGSGSSGGPSPSCSIHGSIIALLLTAPVVVIGAADLWRHRWARAAAVVTAAMVLVVSLYGPSELYPRFFLWALPAVAGCVAVAFPTGSALRRPLIAAAIVAVVEVVAIVPCRARARSRTEQPHG